MPNCRVLVERGRCADHRAHAEQARGTAHARGYDGEWSCYSRAWLQLHRWCGERADFRLHREHSRCAQQDRRTRATVTDHIVSMRMGGQKLDPRNHQSLCAACNSVKAIRVEGAFSQVR